MQTLTHTLFTAKFHALGEGEVVACHFGKIGKVADRALGWRSLIALLTLLVVALLPREEANAQTPSFKTTVVFRSGTEGYNIYRIPAIVRAANGDLLAFCEARVGGDASPTDLVSKRSTDGGKSWGELQIVQNKNDFRSLFKNKETEITVGNPSPVVDMMDPKHSGRIWLPFTVENDRVFVTYSDDHGKTWAKRRDITANVKRKDWGWYATGPVHSIQIQRGKFKGRLVVPSDHRLGDNGKDRGPNGAHAFYSDDHGTSWKLGAIDDTYSDGLNANETTVVELNDGRLYFNTRDQNGKAKGTRGDAFSGDGGATFDTWPEQDGNGNQFKFFRPSSVTLDPPVVQCALLRAASTLDGDKRNVILFSGPDENGPSGKGRSDLRLRFSTDETRTWKDGPLIHVGPAAYSDLAQVSAENSQFGVIFEAGEKRKSAYSTIRFARFTLKDVLK